MDCQELTGRLQKLDPQASPREIARLCLLLTSEVETLDQLENNEVLERAWHDAMLRIHAAADQHAAMTEELEELASSDPREFSRDQIWVLVRAIKVQSQILQLYLGQSAPDI